MLGNQRIERLKKLGDAPFAILHLCCFQQSEPVNSIRSYVRPHGPQLRLELRIRIGLLEVRLKVLALARLRLRLRLWLRIQMRPRLQVEQSLCRSKTGENARMGTMTCID
jgi:hypothetical protein